MDPVAYSQEQGFFLSFALIAGSFWEESKDEVDTRKYDSIKLNRTVILLSWMQQQKKAIKGERKADRLDRRSKS